MYKSVDRDSFRHLITTKGVFDMKGIFYCVSVGPGDPELMTVKAVKTLEGADAVIGAVNREGKTAALDTALAGARLSEKTIVRADISSDDSTDSVRANRAAAAVMDILDEGRDAAMPVLGDAALYSPAAVLTELLIDAGYNCIWIPGVSSISAVAAEERRALAKGNGAAVLLPEDTPHFDELYSMCDTSVIMKIHDMKRVKNLLRGRKFMAVSRCSADEEEVYTRAEDLPDEGDYLTTVIVVR